MKMFDISFITVMIVLSSKYVADMVLTYFDDMYGVNTIMWILISHLFLLLPLSIEEYIKKYKNCKSKNILENILDSIKSTSKTIVATDMMAFIIGFIPFVGIVVSILEFVPFIGQGLVWLFCYFVYRKINDIIRLLGKAFEPITKIMKPIGKIISPIKKMFTSVLKPFLVILKPILFIIDLFFEVININKNCEVTNFNRSLIYTSTSIILALIGEYI